MTFQNFLLLNLVLLTCFSCQQNEGKGPTESGTNNPEKPNIIIFYADDLGYGDLSSYGGDIPTPNIDNIGKKGIRFTNFYVSAPSCTPSRYSLLTGAYPQRSRGHLYDAIFEDNTDSLRAEEKIIPQYLKEQGYQTALIGKWHLGGTPLAHGFDRFAGFTQGCIDYFTHVAEFPVISEDYALDWHEGLQKKDTSGYATELIADYTINYLDEFATNESPFFLYVAFNAPHYGKSAGKLAPKENTINIRGDAPKNFTTVFPSLQAPDEYLERFAHVEDIYRRYYSAMVSAMDENVGKIISKLEAKGELENTMIWFISDNGGYSEKYHGHASNGPLRDQKGTLYEGGIRIPALMSWPANVRKGQVVEQAAINADLLPTIAQIAGFEAVLEGRTIDGQNILPVLLKDTAYHREIYWYFSQTNDFAYRSGDWKLIGDELYNLHQDVSESNNLADVMPEKYAKLKQSYDSVASRMTGYRFVTENNNAQKLISTSDEPTH